METVTAKYNTDGLMSEEITHNTPSSVEVTKNAKGDYQWTIKQYCEPGELDGAVADIEAIDARLRAHFGQKAEG